MKKIFIILIIFQAGLCMHCFAQTISRSTISSSGGTLTGGGNMITYNIGDAFSASLTGGSNMITVGFEQPGEELHTGNISSPICPGSNINVPYTAIDIGAGNTFTVQLSNAAGSFASPVNIGTATGNASGSINVSIPSNIPAGAGYRIRLVSSYPAVSGTDNGSAIIIDAVSLSMTIVNNICHGGNSGSLTATPASTPLTTYAYSITGPTVNNTGASSGVFTGLTAGFYTISLLTQAGCSGSDTATVKEPPGVLPDISLGSDYSSNFFGAVATEANIVYNVTEIAGNAATGDTIRIVKLTGYSFIFDPNLASIDIGTTHYQLDNIHWKLDLSSPSFVSLILDPGQNGIAGTLNCAGKLFVCLKLRRNTSNVSTFGLSARLRRANSEVNLSNNLNSIVFSAE